VQYATRSVGDKLLAYVYGNIRTFKHSQSESTVEIHAHMVIRIILQTLVYLSIAVIILGKYIRQVHKCLCKHKIKAVKCRMYTECISPFLRP